MRAQNSHCWTIASIANRAQAGNGKIYNEVSLFKRQTLRADGQVWVEERTQVQADKFCPRPVQTKQPALGEIEAEAARVRTAIATACLECAACGVVCLE